MDHSLNRAALFSRSARRAAAFALFAVACAGATPASAQQHGHHYQAGDIQIMEPFATPTPPGAKVGAAYISSIANQGGQADRLLRAQSPAAGRVELHSGEIGADGVMRMRELADMPLPPKTTLMMAPGQGNHLMLMEMRKPLKAGDRFPMTLEFERAGRIEIEVVVKAASPGAKPTKHGH